MQPHGAMSRGPHNRRASDRGAVAIVVAVSLTMLLVAAAMLLDFGLVRLDRQQNKSAADAATSAGLVGLDVGDGYPHPFVGVCRALDFLRANRPELSGLPDSGGNVNCPPSTEFQNKRCIPGDPSNDARYEATTSDGKISVLIQSPYLVSDGGFPEESLASLSGDVGEADQQGCDQLGVIITQARRPGLGALATSSDLVSRIRSVGRLEMGEEGRGAVALLILEQQDCQALAIASGGAAGKIVVEGFGPQPGLIHVDSDGSGNGCNKAIILGENPAGGIVAEESEDGSQPGQITVSAHSNLSDGIPRVYTGPLPPGGDPTYRGRITRSPVDDRYLDAVRDAVASADFAWRASPPAGYSEVDCNPTSPVTDTHVFVNCRNFNNAATFEGTHIIFSGMVTADNLRLPNAERVYINGGTTPAGLAVKSTFAMHDHGNGSCPSGPTAGQDRARLFVKDGPLTAAGSADLIMCNTTVILLGSDTEACLPDTSGTAPTKTPCPAGAGTGVISMAGGAELDWTAPNAVDGLASASDWEDLEDLALWTETYGTHNVGGGGAMHLSGVFMVPNAEPFKINGGAGQQVRNSQYIARKLWSTGGGQLTMRPDPHDVVTIPIIGGFTLVR